MTNIWYGININIELRSKKEKRNGKIASLRWNVARSEAEVERYLPINAGLSPKAAIIMPYLVH